MLVAFLAPFMMLQSAAATASEEALRVPGIERLTYGFYQGLSRSGPDSWRARLIYENMRPASSVPTVECSTGPGHSSSSLAVADRFRLLAVAF
jgi:hypothetical protein